MLFLKCIMFLVLCLVFFGAMAVYENNTAVERAQFATKQLGNDNNAPAQVRNDVVAHDAVYLGGLLILGFIGLATFYADIKNCVKKCSKTTTTTATLFMVLLLGLMTGCQKPYEPQTYITAGTNEEMFMIPLIGDVEQQGATHNEEALRKNLVFAKQVRMPQQWIQTGRGFTSGEWRDAALIIKVDKSPVTREWTADPNTGTSALNQAVWVMTSDQVEFSTGWTCTARIAIQNDAVKFLHNYPNGSLEKVLDGEVRAKLQAEFGLEVTDLPMGELRERATPHIVKVVDSITKFFADRGITITNLGITGGFVYKDPTVQKTMIDVFNSEQQKSIAMAQAAAQYEQNKKDLSVKQTEASGIRAVADAKSYEIQKAKEDASMYVELKRLEIEREKLAKWDGHFPDFYVGGSGADGKTPEMLLQLPPTRRVGSTTPVPEK